MQIAFIGGTGFIGPPAVREALARGHQVSVIHRGEHTNLVQGAVRVVADRSDPDALRTALAAVAPDVVVDTRAMTEAQALVATAAIPAATRRWVVLSSQDVYGQFGALLGHPAPPVEERITEDSPLTVPFPYKDLDAHRGDGAYDKKDVERVYRDACAARSATCSVLRLPAVYGHGDPARRFGFILDALEAGAPLQRSGGSWRWTHAHVRDVGHAIALAAERGDPGFRIYNVGEPVAPTMSERAEAIAAAAGIDLVWKDVAPDDLDDAFQHMGPMPNDVVVSSARIRKDLGYAEVTTPEERFSDHLAWLRESRTQPEALSPTITILAVQDHARAVRFYDEAFGWPARVDVPGVFRELDLPDGRTLALYERGGYGVNTGQAPVELPPDGITGTELYIRCKDLDAAIARLEAAGARLLAGRATKPWGDEVAYYADPDGNVIAVGREQ